MKPRFFHAFMMMLCVAIAGSGCAGRDPKPIAIYQDGDIDKTCEQLQSEMLQLRQNADELFPHTDKTFTNAVWGTAGAFFVVPLCGMDLKNAEKVEFEAIAKRHNYLLDIAQHKNCPTDNGSIPSLEEYKTVLEESKNRE